MTNDGITQDRVGTFAVNGHVVTVTQRGIDNTYSLNTNQFVYSATTSGVTDPVSVSSAVSGSPAPVQVTSGSDWLSAVSLINIGGTGGVYSDGSPFYVGLRACAKTTADKKGVMVTLLADRYGCLNWRRPFPEA